MAWRCGLARTDYPTWVERFIDVGLRSINRGVVGDAASGDCRHTHSATDPLTDRDIDTVSDQSTGTTMLGGGRLSGESVPGAVPDNTSSHPDADSDSR